jgi:hypothetical protein
VELTNLSANNADHTDIGDHTLIAIGDRCKTLTHFEITENRCVTGEGILHVVEANRDLQYLDISGTHPCNRHIIQCAPYLTKMTFLDMRNCDLLKSSGLVEIAEYCRQLRYLNISNCDLIDSEGIEAIAKYCSQTLEQIYMNRCPKVSNEAFEWLFRACNHLQVVGVSRTLAKDSAIIELANHSPMLRELDVAHNDDVTNEAVCALAQHCQQLMVSTRGYM